MTARSDRRVKAGRFAATAVVGRFARDPGSGSCPQPVAGTDGQRRRRAGAMAGRVVTLVAVTAAWLLTAAGAPAPADIVQVAATTPDGGLAASRVALYRVTRFDSRPIVNTQSAPAPAEPIDALPDLGSLRVDLSPPAPAAASAAGFVLPVQGTPTSPFGPRFHPILRVWKVHTGQDHAAACGTPVVAVKDGTVTFAGSLGGYGGRVVIDHGAGLATTYNHLSGYAASPGLAVRQGQVIGYVGTTGLSTGCHLHFEVSVAGTLVDPAPYLGLAPAPAVVMPPAVPSTPVTPSTTTPGPSPAPAAGSSSPAPTSAAQAPSSSAASTPPSTTRATTAPAGAAPSCPTTGAPTTTTGPTGSAAPSDPCATGSTAPSTGPSPTTTSASASSSTPARQAGAASRTLADPTPSASTGSHLADATR